MGFFFFGFRVGVRGCARHSCAVSLCFSLYECTVLPIYCFLFLSLCRGGFLFFTDSFTRTHTCALMIFFCVLSFIVLPGHVGWCAGLSLPTVPLSRLRSVRP